MVQPGVVWAVAAVVVGLVVWRFLSAGRKTLTPPWSMGWPLLGETLTMLNARRANYGLKFFQTRVAKYGETFTTSMFFEPHVSVAAPDGNKFLFANEGKLLEYLWPLSVRKLLGKHSLAVLVGEEHKKTRRIFTSFCHQEGLQAFVPRIDAIAQDHMAKHWEGKDNILGVPTLKEFTYAVAADLFASIKGNDPRLRTLHYATEDFLGGLLQIPIDLPGFAYRKGRLARATVDTVLDILIAERKQELKQGVASPKKDLLSILLTTPNEEGGIMSDNAVKHHINHLLFASHDIISSTTMAVVLKYLQ